MNVLMINVSWERRGGAQISSADLASGLQASGHSVRRWGARGEEGAVSFSRRGTTRAARTLVALGLHRDKAQLLSYLSPYHPDVAWADVIHCNNLHGGFFSLPALKLLALKKPVLWTLRDFDSVWGGCDFPLDCENWRDGCRHCPQIGGSHLPKGTSTEEGLQIRRKLRREARITYVVISQWMAQQLRKDEHFSHIRLEVVPNGINVDTFNPIAARTRRDLGLPEGKRLVLFAASNLMAHWKGTQMAIDAFSQLDVAAISPILVGRHSAEFLTSIKHLSAATVIGEVRDRTKMASYLATADVVVVPSRQETFGRISSEAMACGTPVVAFTGTAVGEQIVDGITGCLASTLDGSSLASAIRRALRLGPRDSVSRNCRDHVLKNYSLAKCVREYERIYRRLVSRV